MTDYQHKVQYYETDRMGITHHSNYVRFMEEGRVHFLEELGFPFEQLEADGLVSPVTQVTCDYKATSTFADCLSIKVSVALVKAARLALDYEITNQNGQLVALGHSEHSFLDMTGTFVNLKKTYPDFFAVLKEQEQLHG